MELFVLFYYSVAIRSSLMQNAPIKILEMLPKKKKERKKNTSPHVYSIILSYFSPHIVFVFLNNRPQAVSAPHCCSAVIIGSERSILNLAMQSCDSCVGGQHEQRSPVYLYACTVYMFKSVFMCCRDKMMHHFNNIYILLF